MLKSSLFVSLLSLFISFISFFSQILIANYFGASSDLDVFLAASSIPTMIAAIITSAFSYSLTPLLIKSRFNNSFNYDIYLGKFIVKITMLASCVFLIGVLLSLFSIKFLYPNFLGQRYDLFVKVSIITWVTSLISIILSFFVSLFNSKEMFKYPLILSVLPYILSIILMYYLRFYLGILAIPLGVMIGTLINFIISIAANNKDIKYTKLKNSEVSISINNYIKKIPVVSIAMLCFSIYQSIDAYWGPRLGENNLSYLGYCQRIVIAVGTLVIVGPSTVLVPRLTIAIAENRKMDFLNDSTTVVKLIIALGSILALIFSILSKSIIEIMFQRGKFTNENTIGVASIFPYMLIGMVFMLCVVMLYRAFFVNTMGDKVAFLGLLSTVLYFSFSGIGSNYFGLTGIAISYILTWAIMFFLSIGLLYKKNYDVIINASTFYFILKQIVSLLITGIIVSTVYNNSYKELFNVHLLNLLVQVIITSVIGMSIYFLLSIYVLKQNEVVIFFKGIKSLLIRRS